MSTAHFVLQTSGRDDLDFDRLRYGLPLTDQTLKLRIPILVVDTEDGRLFLFRVQNKGAISLLDHIPLLLHFLGQFAYNLGEIFLQNMFFPLKVSLAVRVLKLQYFFDVASSLVNLVFSYLLSDMDVFLFALLILLSFFVKFFVLFLESLPLGLEVINVHFIDINGITRLEEDSFRITDTHVR